MVGVTVVYVGENRSFLKGLQKRYTTHHVRSGIRTIEVAQAEDAQVIVLDAASLGTTGERICARIHTSLPDVCLIHIYADKPPSKSDHADEVMVMPFTSRKLNNCVDRLLKASTVHSDDLLVCGPFAMSIEKRILLAHGQEITLTPKQIALLQAFFSHPNEVLDRAWLMHKVWDTTYTGDTRTLDVHIRWVRKVLEDGSKNPKYLKTIRGEGYRLEVNISDQS
ncbi:MAG: response regulator transcription factor [Anaerolineae bacterium]|nr:response regulator transcription factor [Anaerolineae bacterium]